MRLPGHGVEAPGRFELPTSGLGNRCSIHLSYGAVPELTALSHADLQIMTYAVIVLFGVPTVSRTQKTAEKKSFGGRCV